MLGYVARAVASWRQGTSGIYKLGQTSEFWNKISENSPDVTSNRQVNENNNHDTKQHYSCPQGKHLNTYLVYL
jgi:hypothetical protein